MATARTAAIEESNKKYDTLRWIQTVIAAMYLGGGVVGSIIYKTPLLGLLFNGVLGLTLCILLFLNNQWAMSVTKTLCLTRAGITGFVIAIMLPYFLHLGVLGWAFLALFAVDLITVVMLGNAADDVYFSDMHKL